jgi:HAMP domain-containing protein/signal transduction histidine kinase/CheY-like chemotaxis protein
MSQTATLPDSQSRNLLAALRAFRRGDFSVRLADDLTGIDGEIAAAFNDVVQMNAMMASEFERLGVAVGKDGKIGQRGDLPGAKGGWHSCVNSVNSLIGDLVQPTIEVSRVIGSVARGDLSQTMQLEIDGRPLRGEFLRIGKTVNTMVGQLGSFASEVTRVAREVGTEGNLGGQARVRGVAGTWKDLTDNVNLMAANLTGQVRNIAEVTTAVAKGDLSKKITVDVKGEILQLKNTINTMVDQLGSFASEVTRVAREVGTEGKLGGQARVEGVAGTWKDLTDNVNAMATNLTGQVRNIAEVTTAVAQGDLSKKITVDVKGEILQLKNTINTMVDQLNSFASEVTRVAREVGTEGKLGGQARVEGVAGTWKDLTDNVNAMATNLTGQVRNIAEVTTAVAQGDLSKKITVDVKGEILELKNTINTMVDQLNSFASEVTRVAREVGTEGNLGGQARVEGVAGTWKDLTDNVNAMATNLTGQVRNIAEVTTAVAQGDLSKKITVDVKGEILELKNTINTMVDQLNSFASEVTRVAREVGTEGNLGGQARVDGVDGTWKDLTDNVNMMAENLTNQVRGIAEVVTAVAKGDLTRKLEVETKGEIAALADTINFMIETLATFADQVTNVAREVGIDGKLGGQAKVPGAAGLWRDLTDNVNQLAANLTTQVRAIAEVATAVTKGDLTQSITVEAQGEVAVLKDNINEMIRNLKDTTLKNTEQDWLKTNLARFSRMLQGERDLNTVTNLILSELAPLVNAQYAVFYVTNRDDDVVTLDLVASYATEQQADLAKKIRLREGLIGQCAADKRRMLLPSVPQQYLRIGSALGDAPPASILVLPVLFEGEVNAVIELASFNTFSDTHQLFLDQLMESIGIVLNTIAATMRTEGLLQQSQLLTRELQSQQEELKTTNDRLELQAKSLRESEELLKNQQDELRRTNEELQEKAILLSNEKKQVEAKNIEIEMARSAVEEKAEQLALTSKYKSEFLANMSHELRTPLNSLLILSKLLSDNPDGNLTEKQTDFCRTIHAAGSDLLSLINDILDLSKIESGTVTLDVGDLPLEHLRMHMERTFTQIANDRKLNFNIKFDNVPTTIRTDEKRLQQVVMNLLSNAFKFTHEGSVTLSATVIPHNWSASHRLGNVTSPALAISVTDTGIGIPDDKQRLIFEAFQQADGTTSRKYGGTGLGLSISREIARLLEGEIQVSSTPGRGSTFTLYLPLDFQPAVEQHHFSRSPARYVNSGADAGLALLAPIEIDDDRDRLQAGDPVVLVVEDDLGFASILLDLVRERGAKGIVATTGAGVLALAKRYQPNAITLDVGLPDMDGLALLDLLKRDPATRHIPVHMISGDDLQVGGLLLGAHGFTGKPADRDTLLAALEEISRYSLHRTRSLLLFDQNAAHSEATAKMVQTADINVTVASSKAGLSACLEAMKPDCIVVDAASFDDESAEIVRQYRERQGHDHIPVIVYSDQIQSAAGNGARSVRNDLLLEAKGKGELLKETSLFLHQALSGMTTDQRSLIGQIRQKDPVLRGKKILIVDDDIRNIFSLTSVLEQHEVRVIYAESGRDGVQILLNEPDIDIALIDIMMPDMDGYQTMGVIRQHEQLRGLPLIAVTAKAMKGDRQKCMEAGASDYISKPVDVDHLVSLLRVWMLRRQIHAMAGE